jgi:indole-3-glycerol phosphate synthase
MTEESNMSVLDGIIAGVVQDLGQRITDTPLSELRSRVADVAPALDPLPTFRESGVSIIAEVKRKSPSKGELADIPDPASLAGQYARGGAAAIGVLTERVAAAVDDPTCSGSSRALTSFRERA